jgi:uncharacterized protein DUF2188
MADRFIVVVPEPRGGWAVTRSGERTPLSLHESASDAERTALRECEDDERVIVRDRYGRTRSADRFGSRR